MEKKLKNNKTKYLKICKFWLKVNKLFAVYSQST